MKYIALILTFVAFANFSHARDNYVVVTEVVKTDWTSHWMTPNILTTKVDVDCWKNNFKIDTHMVQENNYQNPDQKVFSLVTTLTYRSYIGPGDHFACLAFSTHDLKIDLKEYRAEGAQIRVVGGDHLILE